MHKTIYVSNKRVWEEATDAADKRGISLSAYVTEAMDAYLTIKPDDPATAARRLVRQLTSLLEEVEAKEGKEKSAVSERQRKAAHKAWETRRRNTGSP